MSRRISKTVYNWISNDWSEIENRKFIYDGWNLISEVVAACPPMEGTVSGEPPTHALGGQLNLNPNNSPQNEFVLTLPDGSTITRDDLIQSYGGYAGPAASIHVKPKAAGKQDGLLVDGAPYELDNSKAYDIVSGSMTVNLYNDRVDKKGRAMGHWWISLESTDATITVAGQEHSTLTASRFTNFYIWGLDLSGSLQGAGGVGGLLTVTQGTNTYLPTYDGNGNISEYLATDGIIAGHYEYSPFGETIVVSGSLADSFEHRFSTKPYEKYTGLVLYEYRYYSPSLGRWLSRDPIDAIMFNLYAFVDNDVMDYVDTDGMAKFGPDGGSRSGDGKGGDGGKDGGGGNGLPPPPPPSPSPTTKPCCPKDIDAAKSMIMDTAASLIKQADKIPNASGELNALALAAIEAAKAGKACGKMTEVGNTCSDFAKEPKDNPGGAYACCMGIYLLYPGGGLGHAFCTLLASKV